MGRVVKGRVQKMCGNGDMDEETRTTGEGEGMECWSPSLEIDQGWFRWKAPSKPGQKLAIMAICASGHVKKGQDVPMSFAVAEPMLTTDDTIIEGNRSYN